jgi:hypothetical protein
MVYSHFEDCKIQNHSDGQGYRSVWENAGNSHLSTHRSWDFHLSRPIAARSKTHTAISSALSTIKFTQAKPQSLS